MLWERLPLELVCQIVSDSGLDHQDLARLARVNRSLGALATSYLYQDVELRESHVIEFGSLQKFHRSMTESPSLANLTRTAKILWSSRPNTALDVISIVGKLQCLEHLELDPDDKFDFGRILEINPLAQLKSLRIKSLEFPCSQFIKLIQPPHLESLTVEALAGNPGEVLQPASVKCQTQPSLKSLTIQIKDTAPYELPPYVIDPLLACCPKLVQFSCDVYHTSICPSLLGRRLLAHYRETLSSLELKITGHEDLDDTFADLHGFENLKSLDICSDFLMDENERRDPKHRKALYTRLPASLEVLKIEFSVGCYALKPQYFDKSKPEWEVQDEDFAWLVEIAEHKDSHLPRLSSVQIFERPIRTCFMENSGSIFYHKCLSFAIDSPFREAEIELEIYLRITRLRTPVRRPGLNLIPVDAGDKKPESRLGTVIKP